jgi:hypothetical protein
VSNSYSDINQLERSLSQLNEAQRSIRTMLRLSNHALDRCVHTLSIIACDDKAPKDIRRQVFEAIKDVRAILGEGI